MLDVAGLSRFGPACKKAEAAHPLISLWKDQVAGGRALSLKERIYFMYQRAQIGGFAFHKLTRPADGQVVFYPSFDTPSTFGAMEPLMDALFTQGDPPFLLSNHETKSALKRSLPGSSVDVRVWLAHLSSQQRKSARLEATALSRTIQAIFRDEYDEAILHSLELGTLAKQAGETHLRGAGALVVETEYPPIAKGLILGAKRVGVPTITIQHGLLGSNHFPMDCDAFFCWGNYFKEVAIRHGIREEAVHVTGCPRYDILETQRQMAPDPCIRQAMGGRPGCPLVLLISNAHAKRIYKDVYQCYFRSVQKLLETNICVALRPHPAEKGLESYRGEISDMLLDKMVVVPSTISLSNAIRHSDVAYNVFSAAALEALLLDVPVLYTAIEGGPKLTDLPDLGGGRWCSEDQVVELCRTLAPGGTERNTLLRKQNAFLNGAIANRGKATAMSLAAIQEISSSRN